MNVAGQQQEPKPSLNKNLSTQDSRNSINMVPRNTAKQAEYGDCSLRLFTFMNLKEESRKKDEKGLKRKKSSRQCKKKQICKAPSFNTIKQDNPGLISMIEESRKKREHFLKLIIEDECAPTLENNRRCKTPTGRKKQHSLTPKAHYDRKPSTHRMSMVNAAVSPKNTLFRARSSLGSIAQIKKTSGAKENDQPSKKKSCTKRKQTSQKELLKKKEQLQKKLLEINQSLFLKKRTTGGIKGREKNCLKPI